MRDGGTGVLIVQDPLGLDPVHWLNARVLGRRAPAYFDMMDRCAHSQLPRGTATGRLLPVPHPHHDRQLSSGNALRRQAGTT